MDNNNNSNKNEVSNFHTLKEKEILDLKFRNDYFDSLRGETLNKKLKHVLLTHNDHKVWCFFFD